MKDLKAFVTELVGSEALRNGLAEALKNNKLAEFLKENDCDADPAELVDFFRKAKETGENESMSLDDMDEVAGGSFWSTLGHIGEMFSDFVKGSHHGNYY